MRTQTPEENVSVILARHVKRVDATHCKDEREEGRYGNLPRRVARSRPGGRGRARRWQRGGGSQKGDCGDSGRGDTHGWDFDGGAGLGMEEWRASVRDEESAKNMCWDYCPFHWVNKHSTVPYLLNGLIGSGAW